MKFSAITKPMRYCHRQPLKKILLVMKLVTFLVTIALVQASAKGYSQITLHEKNASFEKVMKEIEKQSGYDLFYKKNDLLTAPITIDVNNVSLQDALDECFKSMQVTYKIVDKNILLVAKDPTFFDKLKAAFTATDVRGRVVNEQNEPVAGANVRLKDNSQATTTDINGLFSFNGVKENAVVVISFIGYQPLEIPAKQYMGDIHLVPGNSKLDEVQVVAYGTTTERLTTGSIGKVTMTQIENSPQSNPILAIEGRIPGVNITENSGTAGASFNINIRGLSTISAGTLPLYIVDGVPFSGAAVEQSSGGSYVIPSGIIGSAGFNPLNVLSPDMIESIEVLKDADATAIYGSRAANGVIVITTKKGKAGATKVDAGLYSGISTPTHTVPMLDASQYISMREKAFANDGITPTATNAPDLVSFAPGSNTDFQKYFLDKGHFTNANVSISGGSEQTQFLVNSSYRYESPLFPGDFSDQVSHVMFSIQHTSKDKRFKLNASANYSADNNDIPVYNLYTTYNLPPNLPLHTSTGALAWYTGFTNPLGALLNPTTEKTTDLLGNISLSYQIAKGLTFTADGGYHTTQVNNTEALLRGSKNPSSATASTGTVYQNYTNTKLYTIEPQLNYTTTIAKGKLTALVGGTYQYNNSVQPVYYTGTFTSDALYNDIGSITISSKSSNFFERKYESVFARLNYVWDDKYIINGSFRRDGSSTFSPGNRFGNFGSVGAAWIISEENFLKDNLDWVSFLKLRSSYGSVGNDQIPQYGYLTTYRSSTAYAGSPSLAPSRLANDDNYSWEVTKKLDITTDMGFLKDRILLTASWFRDMTSNLLLTTVPVASQVGFNGYAGNVPGIKVKNSGIEIELNTINIQTPKFTWKSSFNITASKNKLVSFPGLASSAFAAGFTGRTGSSPGYVIGQPLNLLFGYEFTGFKNGVATVKDQNGDGVITPGLLANGQGDYVALGTSDPKYYGGLSNTFSYGHFQLDVLLQFVKKKDYNIYHGINYAPGGLATNFGTSNEPADVLKEPFTYSANSASAVSTSFINYYALSSATITDASYIRLKNVSLTYHLPTQWLNRIGIQSAGVFFRAENLFTITKYLGFDPENFGTTFPLNKMISLGLQTSF